LRIATGQPAVQLRLADVLDGGHGSALVGVLDRAAVELEGQLDRVHVGEPGQLPDRPAVVEVRDDVPEVEDNGAEYQRSKNHKGTKDTKKTKTEVIYEQSSLSSSSLCPLCLCGYFSPGTFTITASASEPSRDRTPQPSTSRPSGVIASACTGPTSCSPPK